MSASASRRVALGLSAQVSLLVVLELCILTVYPGRTMTQTAKIFRTGNSQAVRLPKEFRFDVSEVEISREGDAIVLRPRRNSAERWQNLLAAMEIGLSDDFMANGREQPPMPEDDPNEMFD